MKYIVTLVLIAALASSAQASITCDGCEWVIGKLQNYLLNDTKLDNETVTLIDDDICQHLPEKYHDTCDQLAAAYIPAAMEAVESKFLAPDAVCDALHLCSSMSHFDAVEHRQLGGKLECELCQLAADFLAKELDSNKTETKLVDDVVKMCDFLPSAEKTLCTSAVEGEGPQVLQWLATKLQSQGCEDVKLCENKGAVVAPTNDEELHGVSGAIECSLCELVMGKLQSMVENSTTLDDKVETVLEDDFCTLLPESVQQICNSTVANETPAILYSLADKFLNPDTDCKSLGLCKDQLYGSEDSLKCQICQKVADFLDKDVLESSAAEGFVVKELDGVCSLLPSAYSSVCQAAAEAAAPKVMQVIGQFVDSQGCADLHLC